MTEDTFVPPQGVAFVPLDETPPPPQEIVFVLVPNLSMLAFAAAIEPLRIANQLTGKPLFKWRTLSEDGENVRASNSVELGGVDGPLCELDRNAHVFVCSGVLPEQNTSQKTADWIRAHWRKGCTVGGAVYRGAYTLARAGMLKGRAFTLHWENLPPFRELHPDLEPREQLYVIDDRIMTASGGTAATDLFLRLINDRFGLTLSQAVLNMCIHSLHRAEAEAQQSSRSASIGIRNENLVRVIKHFEANIDQPPLNLDEVADEFGISRRQIERLFTKHLGISPKRYFAQLRLGRARALLAETDLPVAEIAAAVGFDSSTYFARRFRDMFGVTPPHRFAAGGRSGAD